MLLASVVAAFLGGEAIELIASASFPGTATDLSGLTGSVTVHGAPVPLNRLGGLGSAIDWIAGDDYLMVSDRGPGDGITPYPARMHRVRFAVDAEKRAATLELLSTTLLRQPNGQPYSGAMADRPRLDAEGLRVGPGGSVFVSDEYGPFLLEFGLDGKQRRSLELPAKLLCPAPGNHLTDELPPTVTTGRFPNKGMKAWPGRPAASSSA